RGDALPERRDLRAPRRRQARARGALPRDGHHRLHARVPLQGSRAGRQHHLRRHGRHRRHADARRPLLRRRHPHELGDHAEPAAPHPLHRQHPRPAGYRREDTLLIHANPESHIPNPEAWRRNLFAVTAASFMGYTGFTLAMPFLPLFIGQLGVTDVGQISMWTGLSLGITPGLTALLAPVWGRLGDRFGRKIMVERSLVSFVVLFAAMAYVTRVWHVLAIRVVQGLFAGYGSLSVAMAAESAPRDRMPNAIGTVQTAQRIGP